MTKWFGPAAWGKKEARAGDRLPYARHVDASTLRLRDGSLMRSLRLAGFPFETADDDVLNHLLGVRDVVLRSALNSKAVLYHHLIRRRVQVDLGARNRRSLLRPSSTAAGGAARPGSAVRQRPVPDDRPPPAARQGRLARAAGNRFGAQAGSGADAAPRRSNSIPRPPR